MAFKRIEIGTLVNFLSHEAHLHWPRFGSPRQAQFASVQLCLHRLGYHENAGGASGKKKQFSQHCCRLSVTSAVSAANCHSGSRELAVNFAQLQLLV